MSRVYHNIDTEHREHSNAGSQPLNPVTGERKYTTRGFIADKVAAAAQKVKFVFGVVVIDSA